MPTLEEVRSECLDGRKQRKHIRDFWEKKLSIYGLSKHQLTDHEIQYIQGHAAFTMAFDPELKPGHWATRNAKRSGVTPGELYGLNKIEVQENGRKDIPEWAKNNRHFEALLLAVYPALGKASPRSTPDTISTARRNAARMAAQVYLAYRCGWSNFDIAEAFEIYEQAVDVNLRRIKKHAEAFFSTKRDQLVDYSVLIHGCHSADDKQPEKCLCKKYIPYEEAAEIVRQGLATWMWMYPNQGNAFQSHGAIVLVSSKKTPRGAMLERAHMERNAEGQDEQQASVEAFGELAQQMIADLIVPFKPDPRQGMPVLTAWGDERTSVSHN